MQAAPVARERILVVDDDLKINELVESAGGQVGAESRLGRNRFWFTIPAA